MKNYSNAIKNALAEDMPTVTLIEMSLSSGTIRLTTAAHDITHNSDVYTASGLVLDIPSSQNQKELQIDSVIMEFTAVDPTLLALFSNETQVNRRVTIKEVILDDVHQVIGELVSKNFTVNSWSDEDDGESATLSVELSNWAGYFQTIRGIRTTQASFNRFVPATTSFINSKDIDIDQVWGGE
jgi:hypothetical protein